MKIVQFVILQLILLTIGCIKCDQYYETYFIKPSDGDQEILNRNAIRSDRYKWPNAIVPFVFADEYSEEDIRKVIKAMNVFKERTCVKFVPKTKDHREHIRFLKSPACGSSIGFRSNRSEPLDVTYSPYCLNLRGAIQHELLHVLGLLHEQCRPDRDQYIDIIWENIDPQFYQNFAKATDDVVDTFDLPYDYKSLMHYPGNAFAKSGNFNTTTMIAIKYPSMALGQSIEPTYYDLEKIRRMYLC